MIYYIIFFILFISGIYDLTNKNNLIKKANLYLLALVLILFAGLRWQIWTDWDNYNYIFQSGFLLSFIETGYQCLCYIFYNLFGDITYLNTFISFTLTSLTLFVLKKFNCQYCFIALIPFFASYLLGLGGSRQFMAISICQLSLIFIYKRKLIPFLFTIFIATLFHRTSIIFLCAYWLVKLKRKNIAIILILSFLVSFTNVTSLLNKILSLLLLPFTGGIVSKYIDYTNAGQVNNIYSLGYIFSFLKRFFIFYVFAFFIVPKSNNQKLTNMLVKLYGCSVLIWLVFSFSQVIQRLALYFEYSIVYIFPILIENLKKKYNKIALYILLTFLIFYSTLEYRLSNYHPTLYIPYRAKIFDFIITLD